ncbi:rapamycin-insensitive companion of mTOR-like [Pholidichthys leucotaenia]
MSGVRGCSSRTSRMRGRTDSGEENVPLDLSKDPSVTLQEILRSVAQQQGVSNMSKLSHLNNFVKLLCSVGHSEEKLGFTHEEIIICLRLALLNEAKEVRAAGLRALRYFIRNSSILEKVLLLHVDYLIARCIDIKQSNEIERTQALRLARKMLTVNALVFPTSVTNSLIAVGNDGLQEQDRMVRACIVIICELSLKNPVLVVQRGGLSTILKSVTDCQLSRINEALITTVLHLLNHPHTRHYVRSDVEFEQILAPYTDFHYRHSPDIAEGKLKEDREARFTASKISIVASFRSWAGIITLCKPGNSGIQSLIGLLCIPNMEVRKALLEVLYDIFLLMLPVASADFNEALTSVDPSRFEDSWKLSDGFVVLEAKALLPHRSRTRPDLIDNYLALVLSAFIKSGLFEGLVEVITSSEDIISIWATILVGQLLHMANTILPPSHSHHLHCLPTLMNMAASFNISSEKRLRAISAVNHLKSFHEKKKQGVVPCSLYLDHILRTSREIHFSSDHHPKPQRDNCIFKDIEDAIMTIKDSHILSHKDSLEWNWCLIGTILKWPNVNLHTYKDELLHKFVQRLLFFFKPSSKLYGGLGLVHPKARRLTVVGCQFVEFLLASEEEGQIYLEDLVRDIVQFLFPSAGLKADRCLQGSRLLNTLSQYYILFLGTLSAHPHGVKMMEKCSVFQRMFNLCSLKNQEHLLKLTVTTLDYSRDGLARVILSKVLTSASDTSRLYATKHLRVLLRAGVEFFSTWGIELLVTQLHDHSKIVTTEALDILDEACGDRANLHALIELKPALMHLGQKGMLVLLRYLSIPKGFSYLSERGFITSKIEKWQKGYNLMYVDMIEEQLNEALTTYRKPVSGDNYVRRSNQRVQRPNVYLPVHMYGQLVHDKSGCDHLDAQNVVPDLSYTVRAPSLDNWDGIKQLKAALWALGNIGSSNWGLNLLQEEQVIPDIVDLAYHCEVLSVRGTCLYVLGLISKTRQGCSALKQHGWDAVRHNRNTPWPVVQEELELQPKPYNLLSSIPTNIGVTEPSSPRLNGDTTHPDMSVLDNLKMESSELSAESVVDVGRKQKKDRSPFSVIASGRLRSRLGLSLSLPGRKSCISPYPKDSSQGQVAGPGGKLGIKHSKGGAKGSSLGTAESGGGGEISDFETKAVANDSCLHSFEEREIEKSIPQPAGNQQECSYEHLARNGESGAQFKIRSHSIGTDTPTSGISSMSSSPSKETLPSTLDTDCVSLTSVKSTQAVPTVYSPSPRPSSKPVSIPKSFSVSLGPPSSSHILLRRALSLKSPSVTTLGSSRECGLPGFRDGFGYTMLKYSKSHNSCTSPRDALGYATLRRLQHQRIQPSLSHSEGLASPAKDILFTDAITMKTGSLDSRRSSQRFLKALSFTSLDKEDLLCPINQSTLQRSSSVHSMVPTATFRSCDDYIGLALPADITKMFQIKETPYFQKSASPPFEERPPGFFCGDSEVLSKGCQPVSHRSHLSLSELMTGSRTEQQQVLGSEETGLQEHNSSNCLYCVGLSVLGLKSQNNDSDRAEVPPLSEWSNPLPLNQPETMAQAKLSGMSGSSDAMSLGSVGSSHSTELVLGVKSIPEDASAGRVLLRKEVLRLIINLSSSVGTKNHETSLLTIKEKFPYAFDDICLYSEVSHLLANSMFRLPSRRFIQELFQDAPFAPMYEEVERILSSPQTSPQTLDSLMSAS